MYLRIFGNKKKDWFRIPNPQSATFAEGPRNLRICDLQNLIADRPPLLMNKIN
jgi:hypothetical protein